MTITSIIINLVLAGVAFGSARNWKNTISRVLGLGFLIARGGMLVAGGAFSGMGLIPILIGILMLVLAGLAWWQCRL